MISIIIYESLRHKVGAAAAGLIGTPIGGSVGLVQGGNKRKYQAQLARLNNDKDAEWEFRHSSEVPKALAKGMLGSIPLVGAGTNLYNQIKLDKLKKQIQNHPKMKKK